MRTRAIQRHSNGILTVCGCEQKRVCGKFKLADPLSLARLLEEIAARAELGEFIQEIVFNYERVKQQLEQAALCGNDSWRQDLETKAMARVVDVEQL